MKTYSDYNQLTSRRTRNMIQTFYLQVFLKCLTTYLFTRIEQIHNHSISSKSCVNFHIHYQNFQNGQSSDNHHDKRKFQYNTDRFVGRDNSLLPHSPCNCNTNVSDRELQSGLHPSCTLLALTRYYYQVSTHYQLDQLILDRVCDFDTTRIP